jgi:hypothetical protein
VSFFAYDSYPSFASAFSYSSCVFHQPEGQGQKHLQGQGQKHLQGQVQKHF